MRKVDDSLNAKRAMRDTIARTLTESEAAYSQVRAPHRALAARAERRLTATAATAARAARANGGALWQIVDRSAALLRRLQEL